MQPRPSPWIWVALLGVGVVAVAMVVVALAVSDGDGDREAVTTVPGAEVPSVLGLTEDDAVARLTAAGFQVELAHEVGAEPVGQVVGQAPEPGAALEPGSTVVVRVGAVEDTATETVDDAETTAIPNVVGVDQVDAGAQVEDAGLVADSLPVDTSDPRGTVVAMEPAPGTAVAQGTHVVLSVSIGAAARPAAAVPDVTGLDGREAREALREAGFTVRTVEHETGDAAPGTVVAQEPSAGSSLPLVTRVTVHVAR